MGHSVKLTDAAYRKAVQRAREEDAKEPRAIAVRIEPKRNALVLTLRGDVALIIPRDRVPGLNNAQSRSALTNVVIEGDGEFLLWPDIDVDLSVPNLVADAVGLRSAEQLARKAGSVRSPAKTVASRQNGQKGGRPRKATEAQTRRKRPASKSTAA
jgi:hypothetical protein